MRAPFNIVLDLYIDERHLGALLLNANFKKGGVKMQCVKCKDCDHYKLMRDGAKLIDICFWHSIVLHNIEQEISCYGYKQKKFEVFEK